MPTRTAQLVVMLTGFIAFTSILVAGMLAIRFDRTRDVLQHRLQACECCEDLRR